MGEVEIAGMPAPAGTFSITGLGGQFDPDSPYFEGYQLLPRYLDDIQYPSNSCRWAYICYS